MQARRNVRPLQARSAIGENQTVFEIQEEMLSANGITRGEQTILISPITFNTTGNAFPIWASRMTRTTDKATGPNDVCIVDSVGDESGMYDEARSEDGHNLSRRMVITRFLFS